MVRPPAAAIRDLLVFGGSEGLREISRPVGARNGRFGRNSAPPGSFRNRVRIAQLSYLGDVGWCLPIFPAICDLLVLGGGQEDQKVDFPGLGGCSGLDAPRPKLFACYMRTQ